VDAILVFRNIKFNWCNQIFTVKRKLERNMTEEEAIFDPALSKKKIKKKKTPFDLDAALGEAGNDNADEGKENDGGANEIDENLDLEHFGKKEEKEEETIQFG